MTDHSERLIEWTGERCVPWTDDIQVVYEHYHRYLYAAHLLGGRRVVDLASGEGYGSAILSDGAEHVIGVEIDEASVRHARLNYRRDNLEFRHGDMTRLDESDFGEVDAVVCFEALEHTLEQRAVMEGVAKLLPDDGLFIVSMPDRDVYSGTEGQNNPFHEHELTLGEFQSLLSEWFPYVRLLGQSVATGSVMFPRLADGNWGAGEVLQLEREGDAWAERAPSDPTYLVAVASRSKIPTLPAPSTLIDRRHEIVRSAREREASEHLAKLRRAERLCDELLVERRRTQTSLNLMTRRHDRLFNELAASRAAHEQLAVVQSSALVGMAMRYRHLVERVAPIGSYRRRLYSRSIRALYTAGRRSRPQISIPPVARFTPPVGQPDVSIVIPVFNGWAVTAACLKSLATDICAATFEVIVVDDASSDETAAGLAAVDGIRVIRLEENQGFLGATNSGISAASGRYVVLLNNDTEVRPGWLDALVDIADKNPSVGLVGAKLIYPDGRLQEAGGLIFRDGSGHNYGRFDDPDRSIYSFPREVDYCSGACILVRRQLIEKLGGLDARFAPAYYEDTDLAFAVRKLGFRVVYQPKAVVVHHEGASHGTDITSGTKRFQEANRHKFREKWAAELESQPGPASENARLASWRGKLPRVFVTDEKVPTPDQDSGSRRMFGLLRLLAGRGYRVSFLPANRWLQEPYTSALRDLGIEVLDPGEDVPNFIRSISPDLDLAILSRPSVAWPLIPVFATASPRTRLIYDTVDLHYVRERRRAEIEKDPEVNQFAEGMRYLELSLTSRADLTLVVTDVERQILAAEVPDASIAVLPNIHDDESLGLPFELREGILFVGSFPHPPNRDAAHFLVEDVLPLVWEKLPGVKCYLAGSSPTADILALEHDNVHVLGWVPDLREIYDRVRVFVAPLRYGAGMKGKIGESLAHGLPVVTTTVGAEGMDLQPDHEALIADDPAGLAKAVIDAYFSKEVWERLSVNGRRAVAENFSPHVVGDRLDAILAEALKA